MISLGKTSLVLALVVAFLTGLLVDTLVSQGTSTPPKFDRIVKTLEQSLEKDVFAKSVLVVGEPLISPSDGQIVVPVSLAVRVTSETTNKDGTTTSYDLIDSFKLPYVAVGSNAIVESARVGPLDAFFLPSGSQLANRSVWVSVVPAGGKQWLDVKEQSDIQMTFLTK